MVVLLGAISCSLWLNRNNLVFNKKLPSTIFYLTFQSIMMIQRWEPLSKKRDKEVLQQLVGALRRQIKMIQDGSGVNLPVLGIG